MNDGGYTLAEMLAALMMIGLAIGGFAQGVRVMGLMQARTGVVLQGDRTLRTGEVRLDRLLEREGPFLSSQGRLRGDRSGFEFACGGQVSCRASIDGAPKADLMLRNGQGEVSELPLGLREAWFAYDDGQARYADWPPTGPRRRLKAVHLMTRGTAAEGPVFTVRLWVEQPSACRFDPVAQDCREDAS